MRFLHHVTNTPEHFIPSGNSDSFRTFNKHPPLPPRDRRSAFLRGKKYAKLVQRAADEREIAALAPRLAPSINFPNRLYCALTGRLLDRSMAGVRRHQEGHRYLAAAVRVAEGRQDLLLPEPDLPSSDAEGEGGGGSSDAEAEGAAASGRNGAASPPPEEGEEVLDDAEMMMGTSSGEEGGETGGGRKRGSDDDDGGGIGRSDGTDGGGGAAASAGRRRANRAPKKRVRRG